MHPQRGTFELHCRDVVVRLGEVKRPRSPWRMTMTNERLRNAISARGLTSVKLAERVAVDPKTVERWIATDRIPHRTHRGAVASVVGIDEAYLWPTAAGAGQRSVDDNELISMYPTR